MPGELIAVKGNIIEGWAATGRMIAYKPAVCIFYKDKMIKGLIGTESPEHYYLKPYERMFGFSFELSGISEEEQNIHQLRRNLRVAIGETGESVLWRENSNGSDTKKSKLSVEGIINNARKNFAKKVTKFSQLTYADALVGGMSIRDILSVFYMNYLGRDADDDGLLAYTLQVEAGQMTLDMVRAEMMNSQEFLSYRGERFFGLPGSMFTLPYIWILSGIEPRRAGAEDIDRVLGVHPQTG